ncbi:hypothetical protein HU200_007115 [Digitaria exilis]|uniref:Uncharacterized protein n=1 Tax=Digitaria exilis TaxID=1010633 RepID=A0A835FND0_9POAL|nr:hypothetical protein HU200_007115 [Digitaria exilis]
MLGIVLSVLFLSLLVEHMSVQPSI